MAETAEIKSLDLSAGTNTAPRLRFSEQGYIGLKEFDGVIYEEMRSDLRWPRANKTYQEMSEDATIASALSLFEMMISRVGWKVIPPKDPTEEELKQAKFLEQCMDDMDHSWLTFIKEVCSMFTYGYCVNEKVYRRRYRDQGSKYNDGLVGIKKLPVRSQTTILEWEFSEDGRDLIAVIQDTGLLLDGFRLANTNAAEIRIPRKKFLLFRTDVSSSLYCCSELLFYNNISLKVNSLQYYYTRNSFVFERLGIEKFCGSWSFCARVMKASLVASTCSFVQNRSLIYSRSF